MGTTNDGSGVLLELLSTQGRRQWDVGAIIERYEKRMAMSVLAQFIMLGMQQVGSYALSRHQGDLFVLAASAFLNSVAEVINRHAIPRLLAFNAFPGATGLPELVFSPVGIPDLEAMAEFINKLVEREVITPDPELERHLRQLGGLPEPAIEVATSQPAEPAQEVRAAEETALLLRRLSLAIEPLQELMVIGGDEAIAMLRPLVDDMKQALGAGKVTENDFESRQAQAARRMNGQVAQGTSLKEAAAEYTKVIKGMVKKKLLAKAERNTKLTSQGKEASDLADGLEDDIRQEWLTLMEAVREGMSPDTALNEFRQKAERLISAGLNEAWQIGRQGALTEADRLEIDTLIADQENYLRRFMEELAGQLGEAGDRDTMGGILLANAARMAMYAGSAWTAYNAAKIFNRKPDELWKWEGPIRGSCPDCIEEMELGVRPLSQIRRRPGNVQCKSNCRHELVRVS
jgi:hypothetical protein